MHVESCTKWELHYFLTLYLDTVRFFYINSRLKLAISSYHKCKSLKELMQSLPTSFPCAFASSSTDMGFKMPPYAVKNKPFLLYHYSHWTSLTAVNYGCLETNTISLKVCKHHYWFVSKIATDSLMSLGLYFSGSTRSVWV